MEILLNRNQAMKAVDVAVKFAESASGHQVLQGVLVSAEDGRVRLTTTDLEVWCQAELDAQTRQPGKALVPARKLGTVLKAMPDNRVRLRNEGDDVVCEAGPSEVRLAGLDMEEFPDVEEPQGRLLTMPLTASLVYKVGYAASKDETRYTLTGVLLCVEDRRLKLVATDGHRLARFVGNLPPGSTCDGSGEPVEAIVPVRLLNEGVRLGGKPGGAVTFELHEKTAAVRINGSIRIWSPLIEGRYPAYEETVPSTYTSTVSVAKGALCSAVARMAALSKGRRNSGLALSVEDSCLVLRLGGDAGDGISAVERVAPVRPQGTVPLCGLRIAYLSEALARLPDTAWVDVKFSDEEGASPVAIQGAEGSGAGLLKVIMPYKL
ncbi:MAG: DNA polymerase III subunit beta [Candidatus Tectomicrobia bacterium]|nr:DNA polymerase III subunit beta [Candidatus Tectomicrobia bacterium]